LCATRDPLVAQLPERIPALNAEVWLDLMYRVAERGYSREFSAVVGLVGEIARLCTCCTVKLCRRLGGMWIRDAANRVEALMHAPTRRKLLLGIAVAGVVAVLQLFVSDWMETHVWGALRVGVRVLKEEPMGYAGLALLVLLALSIVVALVDTSPTAAAVSQWLREHRGKASEVAAAPVLSPAEEFEVDFVRQVWANNGHEACQAVANVLDDVIARGREANKYIELLRHPRDELNGAVGQFKACLDPNAPQPFGILQTRLVALVAAYVRAVGWMNQYIEDNPEYATDGPFNLAKWEEWHGRFAADLDTQLAGRKRFKHLAIIPKKDGRAIRPSF